MSLTGVLVPRKFDGFGAVERSELLGVPPVLLRHAIVTIFSREKTSLDVLSNLSEPDFIRFIALPWVAQPRQL